MRWFALWENKSESYPSLRAATKAWALGGTFGRRVEPGVYETGSMARGLLRFVREDKIQQWRGESQQLQS